MISRRAKSDFDLISLRKRLGLNQSQMATLMGLGARAYFTLEQEPDSIKPRHMMLARMVSLQEAVMNKDQSLAEKTVGELAIAYPLPRNS